MQSALATTLVGFAPSVTSSPTCGATSELVGTTPGTNSWHPPVAGVVDDSAQALVAASSTRPSGSGECMGAPPATARLMPGFRAALCAVVGLAWTSPAAAAQTSSTPPERVRRVYAPGPDCPTPAALERELDARLGPGWRAHPDELART